MENFYWRSGNEWDDTPGPKEEIDTSKMKNIGEYRVCTFCDNKNCTDYIGIEEGYGQSIYCKHKLCKFDDTNKLKVKRLELTTERGKRIVKDIHSNYPMTIGDKDSLFFTIWSETGINEFYKNGKLVFKINQG
jgi:hypothetical protein